ncbi:DUF3892 domain-containing protein [Pedobacter alpinus]|uniref:DUF3892 domain-containing protein n=1 Tax=Pedobacter alpinus TaxID=1590643 RepID=A0ABW5TW87_9SPHI
MAIRITCINKANGNHENPYVAISHLGWEDYNSTKKGKNTRVEIYNFLEHEGGMAYVEDFKGNKTKVVTAISPRGTKYVKTEANGTESDNLLSLKECQF